jgi:hypothetical protein
LGLLAASPLSCAASGENAAPAKPVQEKVKRELVVLDRLQPVGFWARVAGSYSTSYDFKAKYKSFVVGRKNVEFRVDYEVEQTLEETTPDGRPKAIRFDVLGLRVTLGRPGTRNYTRGGGKSVSIGSGGYDKSSGGQVVRFVLEDGRVRFDVVSGKLSEMEQKAFLHPLGLGREVASNRSVIPLFGSSEPQAIGSSWDGDKGRALAGLSHLGFQVPERNLSVRGTLTRSEQVGPLGCQVVSGLIVGTNGVVNEFPNDWQMLDANVRIEYEGVYPRDLDFPAVRESIASSSVANAIYYKDKEPVYPSLLEEHHATREVLELR